LRRAVSTVVLVAFAGALAYLSLKRAPQFSEVSWLPMWLRVWSDAHGISRSAVGFGALAFVVGLVLSHRSRRWTGYIDVISYAVFFEVAQIWIPTRVSDLKDVAASVAGVAIAAVLVELLRGVPAKLKS
jgi:VanZ family protein